MPITFKAKMRQGKNTNNRYFGIPNYVKQVMMNVANTHLAWEEFIGADLTKTSVSKVLGMTMPSQVPCNVSFWYIRKSMWQNLHD